MTPAKYYPFTQDQVTTLKDLVSNESTNIRAYFKKIPSDAQETIEELNSIEVVLTMHSVEMDVLRRENLKLKNQVQALELALKVEATA